MTDLVPLAVLTGDLIGSSGLAPERIEEAFAVLGSAAERIAAWQGHPTSLSRYRGDGWQIVVMRPRLALRAALVLRAALRAGGRDLSTRIALASGQDRPPHLPDLNLATGPVFVASGRALDTIEAPAQMVLAGGGALGAAVRLADALSQGWTQAQARAILPMLAPVPPTRILVAESLGIRRQAVEQALIAADYPALSQALEMIEAAQDAG